MKKPLWAPGELEPSIDFACRKLVFSVSEWNTIMEASPLPQSNNPTDWAFQKTLVRCINISAERPRDEIEVNESHPLIISLRHPTASTII
jgi:hypothetical protein